ncbi:nucleotide excision repair endonuclease [Bacillus altitudinis]|uniref:nucleotide excision repair endonuclease n=1 Tax=Bacillus altitudinis TaxID=293387 RepID=UPI003CE8EAEF
MSIKIEIPQMIFSFKKDELHNIPNRSGIYIIFGCNDDVLYVGKAKELRGRVKGHFAGTTSLKDVAHNFYEVSGFFCDDETERDIYETYIINILKPKLNVEKAYTYKTSRFDDVFLSEEAKQHSLEKLKRIDESMDQFGL